MASSAILPYHDSAHNQISKPHTQTQKQKYSVPLKKARGLYSSNTKHNNVDSARGYSQCGGPAATLTHRIKICTHTAHTATAALGAAFIGGTGNGLHSL